MCYLPTYILSAQQTYYPPSSIQCVILRVPTYLLSSMFPLYILSLFQQTSHQMCYPPTYILSAKQMPSKRIILQVSIQCVILQIPSDVLSSKFQRKIYCRLKCHVLLSTQFIFEFISLFLIAGESRPAPGRGVRRHQGDLARLKLIFCNKVPGS